MAKQNKVETLEQKLKDVRAQVADSQQMEEQENMQVIVFKIGKEEYGLHIDQIKEVVLTPNVTPVPEVADYVKGVANVRGNIISIVDLGFRFGVGSKDNNQLGKYTLVVASDEFKLGILVKEVPNTLNISTSEIEDSQNVIGDDASSGQYIKGIIKLKERLIVLIDIFKVLDKVEVN
jgi:purine-binding chemotaxis protein CheW